MGWVLVAIGLLASIGWCVLHGMGAIALWRVPRLRDLEPRTPPGWPRLSVVVAACNEADTLVAAIRSLLAQDYPDLEIVLVNDRSTDRTGETVDRLAAEDSRIRPVHIASLPAGWLGKVNALAQGMGVSSGELVLFSDADVHFSAGALRTAVALLVDERLDHLTLLPRLEPRSLAQAALMANFFSGYVRRLGGASGVVPRTPRPFGFGAFNLVRRAALERSEGFSWLRMEVLDDLGLGALMKSAGSRCGFVVATDELRICWYGSVAEAVRGFEKNMLAVAGYRFAAVPALVMGSLLLGLGPIALFLQREVPAFGLLAAVAAACLLAEALVARARFRLPLGASLLAPLTHLVAAFAVLRAAIACWRRGGIVWRGTFYPLAAVRAGRRVRYP